MYRYPVLEVHFGLFQLTAVVKIDVVLGLSMPGKNKARIGGHDEVQKQKRKKKKKKRV